MKLPTGIELTPTLFFLVSISYKLAWTATSSMLTEFSQNFGPSILLQLNIAYFFPSIPVLLLQTVWNDAMDARLGLPVGALLRTTLGLGSLVLLTAAFPMCTASRTALLLNIALTGLSYGIAFGTSYQLAAKFPPASTVSLTTGFVSSGLVVLVLDLLIKQGPLYTADSMALLFFWVSALTSVGLLAGWLVVLCNWNSLASWTPRRSEMRLPKLDGSRKKEHKNHDAVVHSPPELRMANHGPTLHLHPRHPGLMALHDPQGVSCPGGLGGNKEHHTIHMIMRDSDGGADDGDESKLRKRTTSLASLLLRVSPAALSLALSVGTSMLVFPFFTYMTSTGFMGERLAQVQFYIRLTADISGRLLPKRLQALSARSLLFWALLKTGVTPLVFLAVFRPQDIGGDIGTTALVSAFWVLSGYINTCAYLAVGGMVAKADAGRANGIMTVAFQVACFVSLMMAAWLQYAWFPEDFI